ncbi:MAG: hotdog fold thioesterase [Bacteroidales bacterium]|nr:hotdog fold thioesterase [Bacteroidales bacterium]
MMEQLGIEYLEMKSGYVKARMPVNDKTKQPAGILHGGSSMALAETLGSLGSAFIVGHDQSEIRGMHLSASHIRAVTEGFVIADAVIIHQGRKTHVWNIDIKDESGKLVSTCRLTNFVVTPKKKEE